MCSEQLPKLADRYTLAGAFFPAQNYRHITLHPRLLHRAGHPVEQIDEVVFVAAADVLEQVVEVQAAIALHRLATEALPKIKSARVSATGVEGHTLVLAPLLVPQPPLASTDRPDIAVRA